MKLELPIDTVLPTLRATLRHHAAVVLRAATGAGKTSRVPPALLAEVTGQIVMLEPRRVAARAAARRMAEENGWTLGREIGYQVRFDRLASDATRILVVTEGILVQMLQADPFLEGVGAVVLDEFHERHLSSDLSLAMVRKVQREARPDLKLVVMSATLDPAPLLGYLDAAPEAFLDCPGRLFPVAIEYLPRPDARGLPTLVAQAVQQVLPRHTGDVLVFLPGVGEIQRCQDMLQATARAQGLRLLPLYGDLPPEQQDAVLTRGAQRKVILATNVAETSITIDGVEIVIDSGQARYLRFDPAYGLDRLELGRISRASAEQRAGRAGRQAPGWCMRLWSEHDHRSLPERDLPEIQRVDLASTVLELLAWGERDPRRFPFFEPPDPAALDRACLLLEDLGALREGALTPLGASLARLPVHPRLARLVVEGYRLGDGRRAALLAALLSERDVVFRPSTARPLAAAASTPSDVLDRLEGIEAFARTGYGETVLGPVDANRARNVVRVGQQLAQLAERRLAKEKVEPSDEPLRRALLAGWPDRVAKRREVGGNRAVLVGGRGVRLAEMSSVHHADYFVAIEMDGGAGGDRSEGWVRQASAVESTWLTPCRTHDAVFFDPARERVVGRRQTSYRDLVLTEVEIVPPPNAAAALLAEAATTRLEAALALDDGEVADFLARLRSLAAWMPELGLPEFSPGELAALLPGWTAGRRSFAELRKLPLLDILRGTLEFRQRETLDREAPSRIVVPSGSSLPLTYEPGKNPILAVRIQEIFGWAETPRVAAGRVPVLLHLLAPNYRPQQVTQDLASFWRTTYPMVRKELAGRYPKHSWPLDPLNAKPERKGSSTAKPR